MHTMTELTDESLMQRVQAGDMDAFEQLVTRYRVVVWSMATSMLRRPEDAEEATQDAFVNLFRSRHVYDSARRVNPWLMRIAGNACRDKLRRRRVVHPTVSLALAADVPAPQSEDESTTSPIGELDRLPAKLREPIRLKYLLGLTNQQVARALRMSVSNVKRLVCYGVRIMANRSVEAAT